MLSCQPVYVCIYACQAGWMMWNWYVTSLAIGSSIVCYDGSPFMPHDSVLFDLVDKIGFVALLLCMPHLVFIFIKFYFCIRCLICGKRCTVSNNYLFICTLPLSIDNRSVTVSLSCKWAESLSAPWPTDSHMKMFSEAICVVAITMVNSSSQAYTYNTKSVRCVYVLVSLAEDALWLKMEFWSETR